MDKNVKLLFNKCIGNTVDAGALGLSLEKIQTPTSARGEVWCSLNDAFRNFTGGCIESVCNTGPTGYMCMGMKIQDEWPPGDIFTLFLGHSIGLIEPCHNLINTDTDLWTTSSCTSEACTHTMSRAVMKYKLKGEWVGTQPELILHRVHPGQALCSTGQQHIVVVRRIGMFYTMELGKYPLSPLLFSASKIAFFAD